VLYTAGDLAATMALNVDLRGLSAGHMIYLDGESRTALNADLAALYDSDSAVADRPAVHRIRGLQRR
jgi:hypothetical protein